MNIRFSYILAFVLVVAVIAWLAFPERQTLAKMNIQAGRIERSIEILEKELANKPGSAATAIELSDLYLQIGKEDKALAILRSSLGANPGNNDIRRALASLYIDMGRWENAFSTLPVKLFDLTMVDRAVRRCENTGEFETAEVILLQHDKPTRDNWMKIADWRALRNNPDGEAEALRHALDLDPKALINWVRYFDIQSWRLDAEEVIAAGEVLGNNGLLNRERLETLLDIYQAHGDIQGELRIASSMNALPDAGPADYWRLLQARYQAGEKQPVQTEMLAWISGKQAHTDSMVYNEMLDWLQQDIDQNQDADLAVLLAEATGGSEAAWLDAAETAYRVGRRADARKWLEPFLAKPDASVSALRLGLELEDGDDEEKLKLLERLRDRGAFDSNAYADIAGIYETAGQIEKAADAWRDAANKNPTDLDAWLGLARTLAAANHPDEAARALAAAEKLPSANSDSALLQRAWTYMALADSGKGRQHEQWRKTAKDLLEQASIRDATNSELAMSVAWLTEELDTPEQAFQKWQRVLALLPGNSVALAGIGRTALAAGKTEEALQAAELMASLPDNDANRKERISLLLALASADPKANVPQAVKEKALADSLAEVEKHWNEESAVIVAYQLIAQGKLNQARRLVNRIDSPPPDMLAGLADGYFRAGRNNDASILAMRAAERGDADLLLDMAYILSESGKKEQALDLAKRAESKGSDNPDFPLRLADAYGEAGDYAAQDRLMLARARLTGKEEDWLAAVDRRVWRGDYRGAYSLLAEAEKTHPNSTALVGKTIVVLVDMDKPFSATRVFDTARQHNEKLIDQLDAEALGASGVALAASGRKDAMRIFLTALALEPGQKRASIGLARQLASEGKNGEALRRLGDYVTIHSDDPWGWLELANVKSALNRSGRNEYLKVLALTPLDGNGEPATDVRAARLVALRSLGRENEARRLLEKTFDPNISDPNIACDFAEMMMNISRYDEADDLLRRTIEKYPGHVWAYRLKSISLIRRGRYQDAAVVLKEALLVSPGDFEARRDLAFAEQLMKEYWKAGKNYMDGGRK